MDGYKVLRQVDLVFGRMLIIHGMAKKLYWLEMGTKARLTSHWRG